MPPKKSNAIDDAKREKKDARKKGKVKPVLTRDEQDAEDRAKKAKAKEYRDKRSEEQRPARERAKEKIQAPPVTNQHQANVAINNEKAIRESFGRMVQLDEKDDIIVEMQELILEHNWGSQHESQKMFNIIEVLPPSMYKDLAEKYVDKEEPFYSFWPKYKSLPYVLQAMEKDKDQIEYVPPTKPKAVKYVYPEAGRANKVDPDPWKNKVVALDDEGEIIEQIKPKPKSEKFDKPRQLIIPPCENFFKYEKTSFIKDVFKTFITPIGDQEQKKRLEVIITRNSVNHESFTDSGTTWYLVDKALALFLCKTTRIWNDSVVKAILPRSGNKPIFFKVGYMTQKGSFLPQTEEHFKIEMNSINTLSKTRESKIESILNSEISEDISKFARSFLSSSLTNLDPDVTKYGNPEQRNSYIYESVYIMITLSKGKTKKLFEKLANITVFLKNDKSMFVERIRHQYYIPAILVDLSIEEKLPEVFNDPNQNKDDANNSILREIRTEVRRIAETLYKEQNPTENIPTRPSHTINKPYALLNWKLPCKNNKLDDDVKNSDVFYYNENGKVYCLLISDVYKQIKSGIHPVNPITRVQIDDQFLKRFKELYDFKFDRDDIVVETTEKSTKISILPPVTQPKIPDIAPWLLKMIIKNIKDCEKECETLEKGKRCESLESIKYEESYETDESIKEEDKESDLESEEQELEPKRLNSGTTSSLFGSGSSSKTKPDLDPESDLETNASDENSPRSSTPFDVKEGNICQYCEKKITKTQQKKCPRTKIRNTKHEDKNVWFCDYDCFEYYRCPSFKNQKRRHGRYDSRDRKRK